MFGTGLTSSIFNLELYKDTVTQLRLKPASDYGPEKPVSLLKYCSILNFTYRMDFQILERSGSALQRVFQLYLLFGDTVHAHVLKYYPYPEDS